MGQYWHPVNLDKKEFINPHQLGCGLKLGEMTGNFPGIATALIILTAAMPERRGGGDFDLDSNWHGPERDIANVPEHRMGGGPVVEEYNDIARRTIGRWAGCRVAIVGDYAENSDLPLEFEASTIYHRCIHNDDADSDVPKELRYIDITDDVERVIEHECNGVFFGTGWRSWMSLWDLQEHWNEHQKLMQKSHTPGAIEPVDNYRMKYFNDGFTAIQKKHPEAWTRFIKEL